MPKKERKPVRVQSAVPMAFDFENTEEMSPFDWEVSRSADGMPYVRAGLRVRREQLLGRDYDQLVRALEEYDRQVP